MFERYTVEARRTILFSRSEAARLGSSYIETEHLLLGLLRAGLSPADGLTPDILQQIRKRIEERVPQPLPTATSVDLPMSQDSKTALHYAVKESEALGHASIDCCHLLLGLLRIESSAAAALLREIGIEYAGYRALVADSLLPKSAPAEPLQKTARALHRMLSLARLIQEDGEEPLKRAGWTGKEALGHLIDWATAHHQWIARALTEPEVIASGYPTPSWLPAQHYNNLPWKELFALCHLLNLVLVRVISRIPEAKLDTPCRIGDAEPIPLQELVRRYVAHCGDVMALLSNR
jgi:hypothetical protein